MSKEIVELLKTYLTVKAKADIALIDVDWRVRAGHESAKLKAQRELPSLINRIKSATIPSRLVGVFGEFGNDEVLKNVTEMLVDNGGIVVDVNELFVKMAQRLEPSLGASRSFEPNQQAGLQAFVNKMTENLGIEKIRLNYAQGKVPTFDDLANHCRNILNNSNGWQLLPEYVSDQIVQKVTLGLLDQEKIPVLVINAPVDELGVGHLFTRVTAHNFGSDLISSTELLTVFQNKRDVSATKSVSKKSKQEEKQEKEQENE